MQGVEQRHIEIWNNCLEIIKDIVKEQSYKTWFMPIKPLKIEENTLVIQVPSMFYYEWLEEHYVTLLQKTIKKQLGPNGKLQYDVIIDNEANLNGKNNGGISFPAQKKQSQQDDELEIVAPVRLNGTISNPYIIPGIKKLNIESNLIPKYTFDNFFEGECNRFARAVGISVANKPGTSSFNPLFIYGDTALGKTHLVHAIGNQIKENQKNKQVLYLTSDKFTHMFIDAIKKNNTPEFNNFFQQVDVLIIDDIQYLKGKDRTQDVFFHIFNELHQNSKQIIITSDVPTKDLEGLEDRIISRFKWGVSVDVQMPDYETRYVIIEYNLEKEGTLAPKEVIEYMAFNLKGNVRELEGACTSLAAQASLLKKNIDLDLARDVIDNYVKHRTREVSVEEITKRVCDHFDMPFEQIISKSRKANIVKARQIAMYFSKKLTKSSLANIGKHFGNRDHSTVIHANEQVKNQIDTDPKYRKQVEELEKILSLSFG
jgi:chromosomal replication initiator protein